MNLPTTPETAVEEFNNVVGVGKRVIVFPGDVSPTANYFVTTTRTPAEVLSGHTAVVWVDKHAGCFSLSHVFVAEL